MRQGEREKNNRDWNINIHSLAAALHSSSRRCRSRSSSSSWLSTFDTVLLFTSAKPRTIHTHTTHTKKRKKEELAAVGAAAVAAAAALRLLMVKWNYVRCHLKGPFMYRLRVRMSIWRFLSLSLLYWRRVCVNLYFLVRITHRSSEWQKPLLRNNIYMDMYGRYTV